MRKRREKWEKTSEINRGPLLKKQRWRGNKTIIEIPHRASLFLTLSLTELLYSLTFWCCAHQWAKKRLGIAQVHFHPFLFWANWMIWQDTEWGWQMLICKHLISMMGTEPSRLKYNMQLQRKSTQTVNRFLKSLKSNYCKIRDKWMHHIFQKVVL